MMISPQSKTLKSRWRKELDNRPVALAIRKHFENALDVADDIEAAGAEIADDKELSDVGRTKKLRDLVSSKASSVALAMRALNNAKNAIHKQRLALTPTVKDRADLASAMLRQEIRSLLREKNAGEALKIAMDPDTDSLVIEAIFEAPTLLSNISQVNRERLLEVVTERSASPQLAALADEGEAVELLDAAIRGSTNAMRSAAGMQQVEFDRWFAESTPIDQTSADTEAAKFNAQIVSAAAVALPFAERKGLIDQLLATNVAEMKAA